MHAISSAAVVLALLCAGACGPEALDEEGEACGHADMQECGDGERMGVQLCVEDVSGERRWSSCLFDECDEEGACGPEAFDEEGEECGYADMQECSDGERVGVQLCVERLWSSCFLDVCDEEGAERSCVVDGGEGVERCVAVDNHSLLWGQCAVDECEPGVYNCELDGEAAGWTWTCAMDERGVMVSDKLESCMTPLVLAFGDEPVEFSSPTTAAAFDLSGSGFCTSPDWPTAATPWLARDLNRNGTIDDGGELFGNGTQLASGRRAAHGFEALAGLDVDGDGAITAADPAWPELLVWSDHDGDRRATGWELVPLAALGVETLSLSYRVDARCDARGNCGRERAPFTYRRGGAAAIGHLIDVYLTCE